MKEERKRKSVCVCVCDEFNNESVRRKEKET